MQQNSQLTKRIIIGLIVLLLATGVIWWLARYLTTGTLSVTTSNRNSALVIRDLKSNKDILTVSGASVSKSLRAGTYAVTVAVNDAYTKQTVTVHAHQKSQLTINTRPLAAVTPVSSSSVNYMFADSNGLSFVNTDDALLYHAEPGKNPSLIGGGGGFVSAQWATSLYGVGFRNDGKLYRIEGNATSPLQVPFAYRASSVVTYAVSADKTIYVSDGSTVYRINSDGSFAKASGIVKSNPRVVSISSDGSVVVEGGTEKPTSTTSTKQTDEERANELLKEQDQPVEVAVLSKNGSVVRHNFTVEHNQSYDAVWSPNGKLLLLTGFGQTTVTDTKLNTIARLPTDYVGQAAWQDNNTIIYNDSTNVWSFGLKDSRSVKLASLTNNQGLVDLAVSGNEGTAYMVTRNQQSGTSLSSISLQSGSNKGSNTSLIKLATLLPSQEDGCSIGYTNFASPQVTINADPSYQAYCIGKAQRYFELFKVDLTNIPTVFNPIST